MYRFFTKENTIITKLQKSVPNSSYFYESAPNQATEDPKFTGQNKQNPAPVPSPDKWEVATGRASSIRLGAAGL